MSSGDLNLPSVRAITSMLVEVTLPAATLRFSRASWSATPVRVRPYDRSRCWSMITSSSRSWPPIASTPDTPGMDCNCGASRLSTQSRTSRGVRRSDENPASNTDDDPGSHLRRRGGSTSSGNCVRARSRRREAFCSAVSRSVPYSKIRLTSVRPSSASLDMRTRFSVDASARSSGRVTCSSTTSGDAPG